MRAAEVTLTGSLPPEPHAYLRARARADLSFWPDATKRGDKEAIATAFIELAQKATELEMTPASRSM